MPGRAAVIALVVLLGTGIPVAAVEDVVIESTATGFEPRRTSVALGELVRWTNDDDIKHTTSGRAPLSLWHRPLPAGEIASHLFTQAGSFPYLCRIHPTMTGRVRVGMGAGDDMIEVGERLALRVATRNAPAGFRYRIARRRPGGAWSVWRIITSRTTSWRPPMNAVGEWQFRTRTERISNGSRSGWSPITELQVSG